MKLQSPAVGLIAALALGLTASLAEAAPNHPVPYTFAAGIAAAITDGTSGNPGASPPGANVPCAPSAQHPDPVVLVHGTFARMDDNWQTISPLLANNGYCVYALNYGVNANDPYIGGLQPMETSAQQLAAFVDSVLAQTGATRVDIVGHSQGATMPDYYVKFLGGAAKVNRYVGVAPVYHGTYGALTNNFAQWQAAYPQYSAGFASACGACEEFAPQSPFIQKLNDGAGAAVPGVAYTNIITRYDEAVQPPESGFLSGPNVTNIAVQDQCQVDFADHVALVADPVAAQDVLNALDPSSAKPPACTPVLPVIG